MRILVTPSFERIAKKLHKQQKTVLDEAVRSIAANSAVGEEKIGDLAGIRVYKFVLSGQVILLAYRILDQDTIKLLALGSHENFYRDLKRLSK
ncbi:MAG: addiction module toxin RelE [Proteobacteria bacterium SG_bin4]|nr:MAG: addiction module toxin RelE [Proteobacteria bacterium SG_bin4]